MTDLNCKMAKAMGLPIYSHLPNSETPYPYFVDANGLLVLWRSALSTIYWRPTQRIEQAMMVLEKFGEQCLDGSVRLLGAELVWMERNRWSCWLKLHCYTDHCGWLNVDSVFSQGPLAEAICKAIAEVMKERGDAE